MNKAELIDAVAQKTGETKRLTEGFLDAFVETVMDKVAEGEKVSIVGFGNFEKKERAARTGRNPRTGDEIQIKAKSYPSFTPGKSFKETMNK